MWFYIPFCQVKRLKDSSKSILLLGTPVATVISEQKYIELWRLQQKN